jgi:hypothetical protein
MTLEQLQAQWNARDQALDRNIQLNTWLLRDRLLESGREKIRKAGFGTTAILFYVAFLIPVALFNASHFGQWRFFVPGAVLQAWMVASLVLELSHRAALRELDFNQPVLQLQQVFEAIRIKRLIAVKWGLLTGQIVWWVPFFIVLFKGLLNVDLFAFPFMRQFMLWNLAVGIAIVPASIWIARTASRKFGSSAKYRQFMDLVAGSDVAAARAFIDRLRVFTSHDESVNPDRGSANAPD